MRNILNAILIEQKRDMTGKRLARARGIPGFKMGEQWKFNIKEK